MQVDQAVQGWMEALSPLVDVWTDSLLLLTDWISYFYKV